MWEAAERFLRHYGDTAEAECHARVSYYTMIRNKAAAERWRHQHEIILRLRRGEQPPLKLKTAVLAGRLHDFLGQEDMTAFKLGGLESEITDVIRTAIRQQVQELQPLPQRA